MDNIKVTQGDLLARDLRFALVAARFNDSIVENLVRGAIDALLRHGASEKQIELIRVPGAFDLPLIVRRAAASRRFDAVIALGAVIRGATPHFDLVAGQCAAGLARASEETGVPVAFGVLTTDTIEQADRALRHQGRQQGCRCGAGRARARQPAATDGRLRMRPRADRSARARSLSRKLAMQALYQWQLAGQSASELQPTVRRRRGLR